MAQGRAHLLVGQAVTLTLKPAGRGNWAPITMTIKGQRAAPLLVNPGDTLKIGGVVYRITEVRA